LVGIYKTTKTDGIGQVNFLPDKVITNTKAAFNVGGLTQASVDSNAKYIGPPAPGTVGTRAYIYGPLQRFFNFSLIKNTKITERVSLEFRAQALNVFNMTNFLPNNGGSPNPGAGGQTTIGSAFGQMSYAYRDSSGTVDPGGRIIEWVFRLNF